jgi:large subunit ribosomal protein L35
VDEVLTPLPALAYVRAFPNVEGVRPMPKLKTKGSAKKRFEVKKSGKVKHAKAYAKHLFTFSKGPEHSRRTRGTAFLKPMDAKKVAKELFPYGAS